MRGIATGQDDPQASLRTGDQPSEAQIGEVGRDGPIARLDQVVDGLGRLGDGAHAHE